MRYITILYVLLLPLSLSSQARTISNATFLFSGEIREHADSELFNRWEWKINGIRFSPGPDTLTIPINHSGFDTIYFSREDKPPRIILTKFNPGDVYEILFSPCCFDFDIEESKMLRYLQTLPLDSTTGHPRNNGQIQFKLVNNQSTDTLIGVFGNIPSFFGGQILKENENTILINPFTTGLSTYIYKIKVGKANQFKDDEPLSENSVYVFTKLNYSVSPQFVIKEFLSEVEYRFFQKENLLVTYDGSSNTMQLEIIN